MLTNPSKKSYKIWIIAIAVTIVAAIPLVSFAIQNIFVQSSQVTDIQIGNTPINYVYKEDKLVWERNCLIVKGSNGIYNFNYTGKCQTFIAPEDGYYQVELWGGAGYTFPDYPQYPGGKGGYTKGTISLTKGEELYVYVGGGDGGYGTFNTTDCNIPGFAPIERCNAIRGDGGATDIRLKTGDNWYTSDSLRSRLMVAAGGGGAQYTTLGGGSGGGLIGESLGSAAAGTQTSGYAFGVARPAAGSQSWSGAGNGYYGGMTTAGSPFAAAGGSSYISGYAGVNSVLELGGTAAQPLHSNGTLHYSGKYFINPQMQAGVNTGNGKAVITYLGNTKPVRTNTKLDGVRYVKSCASGNSAYAVPKHWFEIQAIKDGVNIAKGKPVTGTAPYRDDGYSPTLGSYSVITSGDAFGSFSETLTSGLQCITVDLGSVYNLDEVALWLCPTCGTRTYYNNNLSVGSTNASGTTPLSTVLHSYTGTNGYVETSQGRRYSAYE